MPISYKIISEEKLIIESFCGKITLEELKFHKEKLLIDEAYDSKFRILADLVRASFVFSKQYLDDYVKFIISTDKIIDFRQVAVLTNTPEQVSVTTMYDLRKNNLPMNLKIVSTTEAAVEWLGLPFSNIEKFESLLQKLRSYCAC